MAIITAGDFTGKFDLNIAGYKTTDMDVYIERYEVNYLVEMLGKELYDIFIVEIEIPIIDPIYEKLLLPFIEQPNYEIINSKGVSDMLLGFIYFEWQRDQIVQQTANGAVKIKGTNSERAGIQNSNIFGRYNESIKTYKAIQEYITLNSDIYPTFKGVDKDISYISW